jgi:uncharacterized protein (TIGR03067 family)
MRKLLLPLLICFLVGADQADDVKKEMKLLEGEWSMVSAEREGNVLPEEIVKTARRVVKDGETTTELNGTTVLKAKFKVDPSKKPKTIDYELTDGPAKGMAMLGIYEIKGDDFKACLVMSDKERPTDFTTKEGDGRTLSVWKRVKKDK